MSGYDDLTRAREIAETEEYEYRAKCVRFITTFCEDLASHLGVECGKNTRRGVPGEQCHTVEFSDKQVSFIAPPMVRCDSGYIWTEVTVDNKKFDLDVRNCGDSYELTLLGQVFNGSEKVAVFSHIKDKLIESDEDRLNNNRNWLDSTD